MAKSFSYNQVLEHPGLNNMLLAAKGWGVLSGLGVDASSNMILSVAAGSCYIDGVLKTEGSATAVTIDAAHATLDRKDLIVYDASGDIPIKVTGTAAATPQPPDIPSGDILLALIDVSANVSVINAANIKDEIIPIVRSGWTYDGTKLETATAIPNAWTNKDLSSYVGSNHANVMLKAKRIAGFSNHTLAARMDGDTDNFKLSAGDSAESSVYIQTVNDAGYLIVPTSSTGIIEWIGDGVDTWDIWLIGYGV